MKILTAIGDPIIKEKLEKRGYNVVNKDIQYKEGIVEYLEKNKVDCVILNENLEGNEEITELILKIKESIINIIVILDDIKYIKFYKKNNISFLKKENIKNIENIIYFIKKIKYIKKYKIINKKCKFSKIKKVEENKLIRIRNKKEKYKITKKRIILIINLFNFEKNKLNKILKNKLIININLKEEKNIILKINNKNIKIKNIKELNKILIILKNKYKNKKNIFIFINKEEIINKIIVLKKINKIIWLINNDINFLKVNIEKIEKNKINKNILEILLINNIWKGIDVSILKKILKKYKIINKIKEK